MAEPLTPHDRVIVSPGAHPPLVDAIRGYLGHLPPGEFCAGELPKAWWGALEAVEPPVVLDGQMGLLDALGAL